VESPWQQFNQTYKFEQKDVYTVEWHTFYSVVIGYKNFHFFTTHVEWPKTLFVLSGLIYFFKIMFPEQENNIFDRTFFYLDSNRSC